MTEVNHYSTTRPRSEPFHYRHHVKNKAKRPRYNHHPSPSKIFSDRVNLAASAQFEKKFSFEDENPCILPHPSDMFAEGKIQEVNSDLLQLKTELNDVKNSLSDKEIRQWHSHTTSLHCGGKTMHHLRRNYHVELCTQAWCKFHEILTFYPVIPNTVHTSGFLNSVHLCEAPGAFITSLNHFCKSRPDYTYLQWRWVGTTLNPYYEGNSLGCMIADDRFIQETLPNWFFGVDDSGDLMQRENLEGLLTRTQIAEMDEIHLVTADGSINCQNDPGEQETFVSQLHYSEMITALYILSEGGSFVIKMFTMFESCTANLMFLLNCSFKEVHVFKPSTSKAGNSEVYVICLNYKGRSWLDQYFPVLLQAFSSASPDRPLFPSLPPSFIQKLIDCCKFFKDHQVEAITNNINLYENMTDSDEEYAEDVRDCCTELFVEKCQIQMLQRKKKIVKNNLVTSSNVKSCMYSKTLQQRLQGTFNERMQKQQLSWHQKMLGLKQEISQLEMQLVDEPTVLELQNTRELCENNVCNWKETCGKEIQKLLNSPFCSSHVISHWIDAHANSKLTETLSEECKVTPDIVSYIESALKSLSGISQDSQTIICNCSSSSEEPNPVLKILEEHGCVMISRCAITELAKEEKTGLDCSITNQLQQTYNKVHGVFSLVGHQTEGYDKGTKMELVSSILTALKYVSNGGCIILQVNNLLTRFNAGFLYILYKIFDTVYVCNLQANSTISSSCLIICKCYRGCQGRMISYLETLYSSMLSSNERHQSILQILPMSELYEREFEQALTHFNETCLMRQVVAIVNMEMMDDTSDYSSQESGTI
ncbi:cap-specific mRNA (nucleoside-2'-O-)-methyltransferase 2-like [Antedon mediterranea]|uniref:cap-specific mRNA (nucleoside-2'-O-)-methyltransferase 2-like n=1 Tax=Antedon mediterranea TaxID=105859 RepID=UPI003AF9BBB4